MSEAPISIIVLASEREITPIASFLEDRQDFHLVASATLDTNDNDALQLIHQHQPDIVYIDHNFGEKGSWQFAKWVRERYPNMLITMMSLTGDNDWMRRCLSAGVNDFLSKPLDQESFFHHLNVLQEMYAKIKAKKKSPTLFSIIVFAAEHEISQITSFLKGSKVFGLVASADLDITHDEAMKIIRQYRPDLVFMDYQHTPKIRAVREVLPYAGIIMMSVADDPEWGRKCLIAGADDFQTKPLDKGEFFNTIHVVLVNRNRD